MSHDLWVPMVRANEICDRAKAQYLAEHPDTLRGWVRTSIPFRDVKRGPDGWVHISNIATIRSCPYTPKTRHLPTHT